MALEEYVGAVIVEFNAVEYEAISVDEDVKGDKKLVKTMNRKRRAKGRCLMIPEFTLKVTLPIPVEGEPDWLAFDDGKVVNRTVKLSQMTE